MSVVGNDPRHGDTVLVQAGDIVPADLRLLEARDLQVDEWELTGELLPVDKDVSPETGHLYQGSRVIRGSGRGIVVTTGEATEYGKLLRQSRRMRKRSIPTPIPRRYSKLLLALLPPYVAALLWTHHCVLVSSLCLATAALVTLLQNHESFRYPLISMALRRVSDSGIVIRDETCLETIGDLDVVCLDKTGVLTTLNINVGSIYFADETSHPVVSLTDDQRSVLIGVACALCNDVFFIERRDQASPIDKALISYASDHGFDIGELIEQYVRVYDKAFDSAERYVAAGFKHGCATVSFVKGDPEVVLRMCTTYIVASGAVRRMDAGIRRSLHAILDSARRRGDIVLAMAYTREAEMPPHRYHLLCLVCLRNPLKPEVPAWLSCLKAWGIKPIMSTGDRAETALTIGQEAGIGSDPRCFITGKQLTRMPLQEVTRQAASVSIFARLLPSQKGLIVRLLQRKGHRVAMVGDGANDTIALRVADVGISFVEASSPTARNVSHILIRDLADVLTLMAGARRLGLWLKISEVLRTTALGAVILGLYTWMLSHWIR